MKTTTTKKNEQRIAEVLEARKHRDSVMNEVVNIEVIVNEENMREAIETIQFLQKETEKLKNIIDENMKYYHKLLDDKDTYIEKLEGVLLRRILVIDNLQLENSLLIKEIAELNKNLPF